MNRLLLVGRLTRDPELRGNDNNIGVFTLAVNRPYLKDGKREADFIQIKTFKKLAENCSKFLKKGNLVSVDASLQSGKYEKDGKTVFTMEVIANDVRFLEGKGHSDNTGTNNGTDHYQNNRHQEDEDPFPGGHNYDSAGDNDWPF